jgi:mono/diheme cytochrome c family protein
MKRYIRPCSLIFPALLLLASQATLAQTKSIKETNAQTTNAWSGDQLYREFCAACHGTDGRGHGPAADAMRSQPTDLTLIAKHNGGRLNEVAMRMVISGETNVPAHGTTEMPTWGNVFRSISANETFAEMRVNALVKYLQQIQR